MRKLNKKKLTIITTTTAIITMLMGTMLFAGLSVSAATTFTTNGVTVEGVLASDSYVLYPFETDNNLVLGISKYGELINGDPTPEQGLEYDGMDVFANPYVLQKDWSQGWFIDIHYVDTNNNYKRAWAFAMYTDLSDSSGIGGDWKEGCTGGPTDMTVKGGRKTNVWATTDPIKVLYDGPRRFVALTKTTLYDSSSKTADDALVSITITFVFNKDKKIVILYKDIKRLDEGKFTRPFQIEFSNRGEWDIGTTSSPPAYGFFYDNLATVYGPEYHEFYTDAGYNLTGFDVAQMINTAGTYVGFAAFWPQLYGKLIEGTTTITRDTILQSLCTVEKNYTWLELGSFANKTIRYGSLDWPSANDYPIGLGEVDDAPMVFKNGVLMATGYDWATDNDDIVFDIEPHDTDYITVVYKNEINSGTTDMTTEPDTPYVIGEWVFDLRNEEHKKQFRGVTVYGLMDRHDADDDDATTVSWPGNDGIANTIDSEVQYYLNETFNPFDLRDAVHKQEKRWVDITASKSGSTLQLTRGLAAADGPTLGTILGSWPVTLGTANSAGDGNATANYSYLYNNTTDKHWSAKLFVNNTLNGDAAAYLRITFDNDITVADIGSLDFWYYVAPDTSYGPMIYMETHDPLVTSDQADINGPEPSSAGAYPATGGAHQVTFDPSTQSCFWFGNAPDLSGINEGTGTLNDWSVFQNLIPDYIVEFIDIQLGWWGADDDREGTIYVDEITLNNIYTTNLENGKLIPALDWDAYNSFAEKVLINGVLKTRGSGYSINFETGLITFSPALTADHLKVLYSTVAYENNAPEGAYEWMVVGKDAATIDSLGAAYMTEAFDSIKNIAVTKTGLDINDEDYGLNAPYVMNGTTGTKAAYRDSLGRAHLKDDWCTTVPVASSNMLFAGGPRANLGTEYFNDFTMAFYPMGEYVTNDTGHANTLMALSCWDKNTQTNNATTGYATISVYKDINGTIGFLIWGIDGQDTYYTTNWFWSYPAGILGEEDVTVYSGIEYLQQMNPGVTDIILQIDYPANDPIHPDVSVIEKLGTISEKPQHDCPVTPLT